MTKRRPFGYVRKLNSGKYQASYLGPDKSRYNATTTFYSKSDAKSFLTKQAALIQSGRWQSPNSQIAAPAEALLFEEYCKRHIRVQTTKKGLPLRPNTQALYEQLLRNQLAVFGEIPIFEITRGMVTEWWAVECQTGKLTTSSKAYKLLSATMNRAVDEGHITSNPCKVNGAQNASTGRETVVPTPEQVLLIADHINKRYRELVLLTAQSGLRFSEVTALRRKDLRPVTRHGVKAYEINIERAVTMVGKEFHIDAPKSEFGRRKVELHSSMTAMLDELLEMRVGSKLDDLIFPSATGGFLRHDVFSNSWSRAIKNAGVPTGIRFHSLRHYAGSELGRTGANLAEIKKWIGDKSTVAVMRYIHPTGRTDELVEKMRTVI